MDRILGKQGTESLMVEAKLFLKTETSIKESGKTEICMAMEYFALKRQATFIKVISKMGDRKNLEFTNGTITLINKTFIRVNGSKEFLLALAYNTIEI